MPETLPPFPKYRPHPWPHAHACPECHRAIKWAIDLCYTCLQLARARMENR